ncbi:MAG: AAA family ATPase [Chthonomonadales bacterium]
MRSASIPDAAFGMVQPKPDVPSGPLVQRIAVIGSPGAGKSTLARRLGALLNLPVYHLDALYWKPGWSKPSENEWHDLIERLVAGTSWIVDGNYDATQIPRLKASDAVIYLDYPRALCVGRTLMRIATQFGRVRPDMAPGCPEHLDLPFLAYVWRFNQEYGPRIRERLAAYCSHKPVFIFQSPAQTERFLEEVARTGAWPGTKGDAR